jgi:toxin ParE1/3/4
MEITWSDSAVSRIEEIGNYIAGDRPAAAIRFIDLLIETVEQLALFPHSGSVVPENLAFRQLIVRKCRIIYRVTDQAVEIVTIISPGLSAESLSDL